MKGRHSIPQLAFAVILYAAGPGKAENPPGVFVMPIESYSVSNEILSGLLESLSIALQSEGKFDVFTVADLNVQIQREQMKDQLGCDDVACATEIAGALNKQYVVKGSARIIANELVFTVSLINTRKQSTIRGRARGANKVELYEQHVQAAVRDLLGTGEPSSDPTHLPQSGSPVLDSAINALQSGQYRRARQAARRYLKRNGRAQGPMFARARVVAARASLGVGDVKGASEYWRAVLKDYAKTKGPRLEPYAAESQFELAELRFTKMDGFRIAAARSDTLKNFMDDIVTSLEVGAQQTNTVLKHYRAVTAYASVKWQVAAYTRMGEIYEALVIEVLGTKFVAPDDLEKKIKDAKLPPDARKDVIFKVGQVFYETLQASIPPLECSGATTLARAVREAKAATLKSAFADHARNRLSTYPSTKLASCFDSEASKDPTFLRFSQNEFLSE
jgi:TolA-binding protein